MNSLVNIFANNLLPILFAASAGYALRRTLKVEVRPLGIATFYVFTPALVFKILTETQLAFGDLLRMIGFAGFIILAIAGIAFALARALRLPSGLTSALVLASAFMNSGNYGLSLNLLAFGEAGLAWASLYYITSSVLVFSLGIWTAAAGKTSSLKALAGLLKAPVVYAAPLAFLFRSTGFALPPPVWRAVELLSSAAVPALLVLLGMQIATTRRLTNLSLIAACVGLRLLLSPLLAWLASPLFGLTPLGTSVAILESAMPTAMMTAVIALEYEAQSEFVASAVLVSTLLSPLTVTPLLLLLGA